MVEENVWFILINTVAGKEREVYNALTKIKEIQEVYQLFGEYDIIAKVKAENVDVVTTTLMDKIRKIDGVVTTKTLTGFKF